MIKLDNLSMAFGHKLLFYGVNLILNNNKRYALAGANGAGKSTLMKLMMGEEDSTEGSIFIPKDKTVGWLKQDQFRYENTVITHVVIQGKPLLWEALTEKEALLNSGEWNDDTGYRLGELEEIIGHYQGYGAEALAQKLLTGLGIQPEFQDKPLNRLSGGYKLRVLLAQALFQQPDILLLDEPTNHLDVISISWLEKYLKNEFQGLLVFISHDIQFINQLAHNIIDIDYGEIKEYSGNYQKFLDEKNLIIEQKLQAKKTIDSKIQEMQKFIDRFGAKANKAKQAQSRAKMIEKLEPPDIKNSSRKTPHFDFAIEKPSGKHIVSVKKLSQAYKNQDKKIFDQFHFMIQRGEKVAIMGENGVGKSTLIKTLLNIIPPTEGTIEWGHNTEISYFSQDQHDLLNQSMTVLEWAKREITNRTEQQIRKALAQLLFSKDDIDKNILSLSGGEAAKLLLAKLMLEHRNILVLDEPTNHLDIESTQALANALIRYPGTVIVVSHNRYFINQMSNRILFISHSKKLQDLSGHYDEIEKEIITG